MPICLASPSAIEYNKHTLQVDGSQSMAEVAEAIDKCLIKFERDRGS